MQKKNNGLAIASMILGIVGILLVCVVFGIVPAIIGLILGIVSLIQKKDGKGMAIAGVATSAVAILIFIIIICSGWNPKEKTASEVSNPQDTVQEAASSNEEAKSDAKPIEVNSKKSSDSQALIEEQVLLDQDGIKITVTGMSNSMLGPEISLLVENNTSTNFTVQVRDMSINGFMVSPIFSSEVVAGKKNNDALTLSSSDLETCGIEQLADISLSFHIFNTESWDTILDSDVVEIKTSLSDSYRQENHDDGETLYDTDGIKIVSQGIVNDSIFGPSLKLYIENNSDRNITVQARDTSINGFMTEPTFSPEIASGKKTVTSMTFLSSNLEENGITDIADIETSFHIFLTDGWETVADTDPITITF